MGQGKRMWRILWGFAWFLLPEEARIGRWAYLTNLVDSFHVFEETVCGLQKSFPVCFFFLFVIFFHLSSYSLVIYAELSLKWLLQNAAHTGHDKCNSYYFAVHSWKHALKQMETANLHTIIGYWGGGWGHLASKLPRLGWEFSCIKLRVSSWQILLLFRCGGCWDFKW